MLEIDETTDFFFCKMYEYCLLKKSLLILKDLCEIFVENY